jgi:H+/Cl- antiporter ClcA
VPDARVLSTSVGNLAGIVAAVFLWAFCSATFVKLFAGKWDKQLVWRSLLAGALVCVVALVANGIPFNGHPVIPFVGTFIVGQQVLSGILIGASLDRQFSTKFDTAKASAPG